MIRAERVRITYPDGTLAVRRATLESPPSRLTVLAGPNGGGKSTLLMAIRGLIPRAVEARVEGRIEVYGVDPVADPEEASRIVQGTLQDPKAQVVGPTVLAEAALTLIVRGDPPRRVLDSARRSLRLVGLEGLEDRPTHRLSSGQLARTALAGALSPGPRHLVLDEPSSYLDDAGVETLIRLLRSLTATGIGVLAATHDPRLWEEADECYTLEEGVSRPGCPSIPIPEPLEGSPRAPGKLLAQLEGVWARYPGSDYWALRDANLRVMDGEIIALYGPNGGGKTTLLLVMAGLLGAGKGRIHIAERPALLPSDPLLVFHRGTLREQTGGRVPVWARGLLDKPLFRASGGERRLAGLAAVIATGRRLLLLDEPTDWLDPWWRAKVLRILRSLADAGYGIVVATHDKWLVSAADRVYRVEGGRVWEE